MITDLLEQYPHLAALLPKDFSLQDLARRLGETPCESTLAMVGLGAILFYAAERNHNAKVEDFWDALEYCTSSLNVGYTDVYPQTPVGKIVGSALMTLGPSLVSRVTSGPETPHPDPVQKEILAALREVAEQLKRLGESNSGV
jgi:hypothetical protein